MRENLSDQPATRDANQAWSIISLLLAGILFWGGVGWLVDNYLESAFALPVGILVGAAGAMYLVMKRYDSTPKPNTKDSTETSK